MKVTMLLLYFNTHGFHCISSNNVYLYLLKKKKVYLCQRRFDPIGKESVHVFIRIEVQILLSM